MERLFSCAKSLIGNFKLPGRNIIK